MAWDPCSEHDMEDILLRWAKKKGGVFTEEDLDDFSAILEEHFPNGPEGYSREEVVGRLEELGII